MRYLIGVILAILIIIFVIIKLLSGGGNPESTKKSLLDYADTDTTVRYVIDTPVQASAEHRQIVITVGKDVANLSVLKGYQGEVINSKNYDNNRDAYANFLLGLQRSGGYTQGNDSKSTLDERGYCATGDRYSYDIVDGNGNRIQHYWSTSCGPKTFKGKPGIVRELFREQIPDYDQLTQDISY